MTIYLSPLSLLLMSSLCLGVVGCASGLLVAEGEDLMESGELEQAISRYDEALLKRPAWPQGFEDESEALSELRERLALKLNERVISALEELRWEDACQAATEAEYLDGVSPARPSVALLRPVLSELERRYDEHLMEVESWGELAFILKGLERCKAPPSLIEELLARFAVVVSISIEERARELTERGERSGEERAVWDALNRIEQRSASLYDRLPSDLTERWRAELDELRSEAAQRALRRARAAERYGLAWALASLAGSLDEAERYAALTRQRTLFEVLTAPDDVSLRLSPLAPTAPIRAARKRALKAMSVSAQEPHTTRVHLSIEEERPSCRRSQEEVTGALRLIDHYEERPHPEWLKVIVQVEAAQAHYEARVANLATLQSRLETEPDPLVRSRLQREVELSVTEVRVAEEQLSRLEAESEALPKVTRTPIHVLFRYPVTEWTLECEVTWRLSLSEGEPQGGAPALGEVEHLRWSEVKTSVDRAHRAYPQHDVQADPLRFPEPEATLRSRAREALGRQLATLLRAKAAAARQAMYEASQRPTADPDEQEARLDALATLALTSAGAEEREVLLKLLTYALARDPRWESPSRPLTTDELTLGLRSATPQLEGERREPQAQ